MTFRKKYNLVMTKKAEKDLDKIYFYIKNNLYAAKSANRIIMEIKKTIAHLAFLPEMYAKVYIYNKETIFRKAVVGKYCIIYKIDKIKKVVTIMHIYYSGRDYIRRLIFIKGKK